MSELPLLTLSFAALGIGCPAAKRPRKAPCAAGHYGLANDSSLAVRMIVLSRLMRTRDETMLEEAARSPVGEVVLTQLRSLFLRVALATGGTDPSLSEPQIVTLFLLSGSTVAAQRLYDSGLTLPGKLPWQRAKRLLSVFLDALAASRVVTVGYTIGELLLQKPAAPLDAPAQAQIASLVALVECETSRRLSGGSSRSSSSSARSSPPPAVPAVPAVVPLPGEGGEGGGASAAEGSSSGGGSGGGGSGGPSGSGGPGGPASGHGAHQPPFALDADASLAANVERLAGRRLRRALEPAERAAIGAALEEGLSILQAGDAEARRALLSSCILGALVHPGAAQLWASALEAAEGELESVEALAAAITSDCASIAGVLFASGLGL